jgi:hypothetical protein
MFGIGIGVKIKDSRKKKWHNVSWGGWMAIPLGTSPQLPRRYPPSPRESPQGHKGGLGYVFRSGTMKKNFPGKIVPQNRAYPPSITKTQKKISGKIYTPSCLPIGIFLSLKSREYLFKKTNRNN